ncbi:ephrin type-A receptor 3 isoform X2 [Parambassis ranga]|uniref:receptor protein-tyrosine kinase n=1 Tax=Parambassis ranga TaxID=210632 RepID=A0A6P7KAL1_9TELE|nr:ephrin type-A receptor 3-like isoform X2 [Parambassis ranga]
MDISTPWRTFQNNEVRDISIPTFTWNSSPPNSQVPDHLIHTQPMSLGSVTRRGFQLGFSFSGRCLFMTSIRVYYRRCPDIVFQLVSFGRTAAGSESQLGSCVKGAVEVSPPVRTCTEEGVWGPLQGGCTCALGHQVMDNLCEACRMGYYKSANESGGCRLCPANTGTHREGSERCNCLNGFSRLPTDPYDLGCTKPPSAPVNLTAQHHNDSVLTVTWSPPHDRGGREELKYHVKCEKKETRQWEACNDDVVFLPDPMELTNTSIRIMGLSPRHDYRLSVQAWNDISALQGVAHLSTATFTIHRLWKVPPNVVTPAPQQQSRRFAWLAVGLLSGSVLLVILSVVCFMRRNYTKLRSEQAIMLLPVNVGTSYRRPDTVDTAPQQTNMAQDVVQMLGGISSSLLDSLKEVLVERNKLTLGKELGKGEFGSVYEGTFTPEEGMSIKVAVKTMRVGIYNQEDLHEFLREAEIMKNFDHDNVVRLLGVTLQREEDSSLPVPLVILPYMKHGDLRRFLIATRFGDLPIFVPHQSLLHFMIDIASGMDYLSSRGFLHRDLAARNCMLGDDLRVCVADFGLSKKIYNSSYYRQRVVIRVPIKWMSIESLSESIYTTKSDVWSFGVTMWEIVSRGRTPYPGIHNHELLDLLQSGHRLKLPEDCDQKLYEVMRSCWDREPAQRPGFRELAEELKGLLSELPVLEASQEASYINQGLEVAAAIAASQDPQTDSGGKSTNTYWPSPVGAAAAAAAARDEDMDEDGYLKHISGSAVESDDKD